MEDIYFLQYIFKQEKNTTIHQSNRKITHYFKKKKELIKETQKYLIETKKKELNKNNSKKSTKRLYKFFLEKQ